VGTFSRSPQAIPEPGEREVEWAFISVEISGSTSSRRKGDLTINHPRVRTRRRLRGCSGLPKEMWLGERPPW